MRITILFLALVLACLLAAPSSRSSGGHAEDPHLQQINARVLAYRICFYHALPQAMADLGDNTPNGALADKALDACSAELDELRTFLSGLWDDPELSDVAVKQVRDSTREQALKDFALAKENYGHNLERYKQYKAAQ